MSRVTRILELSEEYQESRLMTYKINTPRELKTALLEYINNKQISDRTPVFQIIDVLYDDHKYDIIHDKLSDFMIRCGLQESMSIGTLINKLGRPEYDFKI
jgi:hypothetical protein